MSFVRGAMAVMGKDLRLELRGKDSLSLMFFLSLLFLVIFNFALDIDRDNVAALAPGVLWVIFAFSGILGMGRTSMAERAEDAFLSVVFSPASEESFFMGKVLSNLVFLLVAEALTMTCFAVLFDYEKLLLSLPGLLPPLVLGTLGFALVGTLFSFLTTTSRYGEVLLPFLFLPVVSPVVLGGVSSMTAVLEGRPLEEAWRWIEVMGVFDVLYFCIALLVFKHIIEE
ncbi:MAG: heme exporter protein CcmB [Nitrospirota bacterium]|jgi:heme exporter protein B